MHEALLERYRRQDRLALARLLTLCVRGQLAEEFFVRLPATQPARVLAVTGSAGVGKSTLAGRLIETIRAAGSTVAVLACDPQSPLSGGALLGDRFRMSVRPDDAGVYIRSLATPGGQGAIVAALPGLIRLFEGFGFEVILIETVGAGQGDVAVRSQCDVLVLLLQPETGDDLQWEKAGVLEVADILVIHKADLPGAPAVEAQVRQMLSLGKQAVPPILRVSARTGSGLAELWQAAQQFPLRRQRPDPEQELLRLAHQTLTARLAAARRADDPAWRDLLQRWQQGELTAATAGADLCSLLQFQYPGVLLREGDPR